MTTTTTMAMMTTTTRCATPMRGASRAVRWDVRRPKGRGGAKIRWRTRAYGGDDDGDAWDGYDDDDDDGARRPSTSGRERRDRGGDGRGRFARGRGDGDGFEDESSSSPRRRRRPTTGGRNGGRGESRRAPRRGVAREGPPPDVLPLTQRDYERVLPIAATGEQYGYFWGDNDTAIQRMGLSLVTTILSANYVVALAIPASTFFLWAPVALAARRNSKVRSAKYAGLWRAKVIDVAPVETRGGSSAEWMLDLLVGDKSGARVPLKVPLKGEYADINVDDDVELIVTSDDPYFYTFQAVREAYLPYLNIWVGEYPFLERRGMMSVSDRFAREFPPGQVVDEESVETR